VVVVGERTCLRFLYLSTHPARIKARCQSCGCGCRVVRIYADQESRMNFSMEQDGSKQWYPTKLAEKIDWRMYMYGMSREEKAEEKKSNGTEKWLRGQDARDGTVL
jgi:hypothetical protein